MAHTPRSLVIAGWLLCVNAVFTIFNELDPFDAAMPIGVDTTVLNTTFSSAMSYVGITSSGPLEMLWNAIGALDIVINLFLGPLTLLPNLLGILGVIGTQATIIIVIVYGLWGLLLFQILIKPLTDVV